MEFEQRIADLFSRPPSPVSLVSGRPLGLSFSHEMVFRALQPDPGLGPFLRVFLWLDLDLKLPPGPSVRALGIAPRLPSGAGVLPPRGSC